MVALTEQLVAVPLLLVLEFDYSDKGTTSNSNDDDGKIVSSNPDGRIFESYRFLFWIRKSNRRLADKSLN